jgi:hypothetical protein
MKHRLLILITGILLFLLTGFTQDQTEKTVLRSTQQSMLISIKSMTNVLAYDITDHTVLSENGEFSHTCYYIYDHFEANIVKLVVGVLLNESNMTNFASTIGDKYRRING